MNKGKRRYVLYATSKKLEMVNPLNKEHIKRYFDSKENKLSESSKKGYISDFNQWLIYILENHENKDILKIDEEESIDMIEDFIAFCIAFLGNNERRMQRRFSSISSFYFSLKKSKQINHNPMDNIERPQVNKGESVQIKQNLLTIDQVKQIRKGLKEIDETQLELFFELALSTMAKANQISNIMIDDIHILHKRIENSNKELLFPSDRCLTLIGKWMKERSNLGIESEYLFVTKYGGIYSNVKKVTLQTSWIKKVGRLIDLPQLHCHDIRYSGANLLFEAGLDLEIIFRILSNKNKDDNFKISYDKIQEEKSRINI